MLSTSVFYPSECGIINFWVSVALLAHLPSEYSVVRRLYIWRLTIVFSDSAIAVGTGFGQLFRGIGAFFWLYLTIRCGSYRTGQVGGVAVSAAIFQSVLNVELHKRIHTDNANEVLKLFHIVGQSLNALVQLITRIRHSTSLVATLPLELQRAARDSYAVALRTVFILAACSTFLAYLARLPVSHSVFACYYRISLLMRMFSTLDTR